MARSASPPEAGGGPWTERLLERALGPFVTRVVERQLARTGNRLPNRQLFHDLAGFVVVNQVEGDYLEFGVYDGSGTSLAHESLARRWHTYQKDAEYFGQEVDPGFLGRKRFVAFDSFEGLPGSADAATPAHYSAGTYSASEARFRANVAAAGIPPDRLITVPGFYDRSLTPEVKARHGLKQAAWVFIDCDLYESAVPCFEFITDLVQTGTVLLLDDFFRYRGAPDQGVQRAYREWLAKNRHVTGAELGRCSANRVGFALHVDRP